jgi:hypothetical protein
MPTVDHEHHDLELRIVVMGGMSREFCSALGLGEHGELVLNEIQGWKPRLVFHAFPLDPWAGDGAAGAELERMVAYADGLVLTDALAHGTHYSSSAVERLGRTLGPTKRGLPAAIFGGPALAQEWETLSGVKPVIVTEPEGGRAQEALKALARVLLRSQMKSTPPPPPARA